MILLSADSKPVAIAKHNITNSKIAQKSIINFFPIVTINAIEKNKLKIIYQLSYENYQSKR